MFRTGVVAIAYVLATGGAALAADPSLDSPLHVQMQDGSVGDAVKECGSGDLCGSLLLANGDTLKIYSERSSAREIDSACQPYTLKIVRMHGDTVLLSYDAQTRMVSKNTDWQLHWNANNCPFRDTYIMFDNGHVKMGVFQDQDGDLSVRFGEVPPSTAQ